MTLMAAACAAQKICPPQCPDIIKKALRVRGLPCSAEYGAEQLYNALLMDKKRAADDITLIVLRDIGCCARMNMPLSQAKEMLAIGIKEAGRCR
jgi:3-dehydroquinate synthetase